MERERREEADEREKAGERAHGRTPMLTGRSLRLNPDLFQDFFFQSVIANPEDSPPSAS